MFLGSGGSRCDPGIFIYTWLRVDPNYYCYCCCYYYYCGCCCYYYYYYY